MKYDIFTQRVVPGFDVVVMDKKTGDLQLLGRASKLRFFVKNICDNCGGELVHEPVIPRVKNAFDPLGAINCRADSCLQLCMFLEAVRGSGEGED